MKFSNNHVHFDIHIQILVNLHDYGLTVSRNHYFVIQKKELNKAAVVGDNARERLRLLEHILKDLEVAEKEFAGHASSNFCTVL